MLNILLFVSILVKMSFIYFRCDAQFEVVGDSLWESVEICMGVANSSHRGDILWIKMDRS